MAAKRKTTKLARALEKDLQGEQVIYRNFQEGKISILRDSRDMYFTAVPGIGIWGRFLRILAVLVLVIAAGLLYYRQEKPGEWKTTIAYWQEYATSTVAKAMAEFRQAPLDKKPPASAPHSQKTVANIPRPVRGATTSSPCILKKSLRETTESTFDRELRFARQCLGVTDGRIYCWNDRQGTTHFSTTGFPEKEYFLPKWVTYK